MPLCDVSAYQSGEDAAANNGVNIFYKTYGQGHVKILMIIGLAGTHDSWGPQIKGLTGTLTPNSDKNFEDDDDGVEVCAFDNRGVGRSSVPIKKSQYTTSIMAKDAIALMDHLGWRKAHVFGHSMGGMIACKLATLVPDRILSLALLNVTGGGYQCLPKLDRVTLSIAFRFLRAKTPEQRADVDLDTHYSKEYLEEYVENQKRREILYKEYVKGISSTGMQSSYGLDGQLNACWTHKLTQKEIELISSAGFLVSVIHGRYELIGTKSPYIISYSVIWDSFARLKRLIVSDVGMMSLHSYAMQKGLLRSCILVLEWLNFMEVISLVMRGLHNAGSVVASFRFNVEYIMIDLLEVLTQGGRLPDVTEQKLVDTESTGNCPVFLSEAGKCI